MPRIAVFLAVLLCASTSPRLVRAADPDPLFEQIDSIVAELSEISGLKRLKPIQYGRITRPELKQFIERRITEVVKPEEIRAEEVTLKKFGFVPQDFDLKSATIELMSEQAAAFYDYRLKKLFILEQGPSEFQNIALVHELAHALADQHFNLQKFVDPGRSDDGAVARLAVIEGQATWLMSEFMARKLGQSLKSSPGLASLMGGASERAEGQFPVFDKAPLYLRETLLFPYTRGMLFMHEVVNRRQQAAFTEVFRSPPLGTNHVLHPEKYFTRERPTDPKLPRVPDGRRFKELSRGTLGELDHWILIRQYLGKEDADRLAPKWRGGEYKVMEAPSATILAYSSEWADASSAEEYFHAYRRVLEGKWGSIKVETESPDIATGTGADGRFEVRLTGTLVTSLEGIPFPPKGKM